MSEVLIEVIEVPEVPELAEVKVKRGRGRPKQPPKEIVPKEPREPKPKGRPRIENPTTAGHPKLGKLYYQNYYKAKIQNDIVSCPTCSMLTKKYNLNNHMKSKLCTQILDIKSTWTARQVMNDIVEPMELNDNLETVELSEVVQVV